MRLSRVHAQNYRGLKDAALQECGSVNVLIGKNNSGKSTILSAINTFFSSLSAGEVVNFTQGARARDFSDRDSNNRIKITCEFDLNPEEKEAIARRIASERPQLQNALVGLDSHNTLSVTLDILGPPIAFSYVSNISLTDAQRSHHLLILEISEQSAHELRDAARSAKELTAAQSYIQKVLYNFDPTDWGRAKARTSESGRLISNPLPLSLRRGPDVPEVLANTVQSALLSSDTFDEFRNTLHDLQSAHETGALKFRAFELTKPIKTYSGEETSIPDYAKSIIGAVSGIKVLYLTEYRKQIGAEEAQKILNLKTRRGGDEMLTSIKSTVLELLGVRVDAFSSESSARETGIAAELDVDDYLVEMNGSGIREALRLVLDTAFEKPAILLVEEPEIHLHPALETSMMRFLQSASKEAQVFITTHSTNFLDRADFQNVYLVHKKRYTEIEHLDYREIEEKVPQELGIRLSSLFMYDRLVFVEGPSDELILREIANTLSVNLSQRSVGFIPLHGIGNLAHYAAREILDFLARRRVKMWFLIDRDERAEEDIEKIRGRLGANTVFLPTRARELENYLLSASANVRYLNSTHEVSVTENEFKDALNLSAERLKPYVMWKWLASRVSPSYPIQARNWADIGMNDIFALIKSDLEAAAERLKERSATLETDNAQITADLEARWNKDKLDLAPGALLLDETYKKWGRRFEKMRDAPKLASMLKVDEVESELKTLINQLSKDN